MKLLLVRKYGKTATKGLLYFKRKFLARILELPRNLPGKKSCLSEGCYRLELAHTEERGWEFQLLDNNRSYLTSIMPLVNGKMLQNNSLAPVSSFSNNAKFSKLTTLKLMERLFELKVEDEEMELEIVGIDNLKTIKSWQCSMAL